MDCKLPGIPLAQGLLFGADLSMPLHTEIHITTTRVEALEAQLRQTTGTGNGEGKGASQQGNASCEKILKRSDGEGEGRTVEEDGGVLLTLECLVRIWRVECLCDDGLKCGGVGERGRV